jgi:hypothetical protein
VQPGPVHHPNALRLCDEVVGFEQDLLLAGREEMEAAVQAVERLSTRCNGSRTR